MSRRQKFQSFLLALILGLAELCYGETKNTTSVHVDFSSRFSKSELKKEILKSISKSGLVAKELNKSEISSHDILVSVGEQAFLRNTSQKSVKHHLVFYIPESTFRIYKKQLPPENKKLNAIYSGQSLERQWALGKNLVLNSNRFATLVEKDFPTNHFPAEASAYPIEGAISDALADALRENPVLILQEFHSILNGENIRRILLSSYRLNTPVIGPNKSVVKAGGLATVFSSKEHLLPALTSSIKAIANNNPMVDCYPFGFDIYVNQQLADSLGIKASSESLIEKIKLAGGNYCD